MDITLFSQDDFDTKAWVNNILHQEAQTKKENVMSLIIKLQIYIQEVSSGLETTSQQVLASLPKLIRDTKTLMDEALVLKNKMSTVKIEITKLEENTGSSIHSIEKLDIINTQLNESKQGLLETDNWAILVNNLEEVFDSKSIEAISQKLISMKESLKLLINVPDYEERRLQLEGLINRLEAVASPQIVRALNDADYEKSAKFVLIFTGIGRIDQLVKYYKKYQRDVLVKQWGKELDQNDCILDGLQGYYTFLLNNWRSQVLWLSQVFGDRISLSATLVDVYVDLLGALDPGVTDCINIALKEVTDKITFIYDFKQVVQQFAMNMVAQVEVINKSK